MRRETKKQRGKSKRKQRDEETETEYELQHGAASNTVERRTGWKENDGRPRMCESGI